MELATAASAIRSRSWLTPEQWSAHERSRWTPFLWAGGIVVLVWAARGSDLQVTTLAQGLPFMASFLVRMLPPNVSRLPALVGPTLETIQMAIWGTLLAIILATPLGVLAAQEAGAEAFAAGVRKSTGKATYNSLIFVRGDAPYQTVADLQGKSFAFVDPASTSGHLFPRAAMAKMGIKDPERFFGRVVFAGAHDAAQLAVLRERPDITVLYCHTTDYAMHMSDPQGELSQYHLREIDKLFGQLLSERPDATFLLTADHGMNYKRRCYDLNKHMPEQGCPICFAMSAERDPYIKHHRSFGGTAYVWLNQPQDRDHALTVLAATEGVEGVYGRQEAAALFHLHPDRIGDLVVVGDADTVFGPMDTASEELPPTYRNHGSRHELAVPLAAYGPRVDLSAWDQCTSNKDLVRLLCLE